MKARTPVRHQQMDPRLAAGRSPGNSAPKAVPPAAGLATILGLQRTAGNAVVTRLLQREPSTPAPTLGQATGPTIPTPVLPPATVPPRKNYVFIMGDSKVDDFYKAAALFFQQHEKDADIVRDKRTLSQILEYVNAGGVPALKIIIVSHANEQGNLGFSLDAADLKKDTTGSGDHKPRLEYRELMAANAAGTMPAADVKLIDALTKVEIKGCNIGRSQLMLDQLDTTFGGHAEVIAPTHKQVYKAYGSKKGLVAEEAFEPYTIEEPGKAADHSAAELEATFRVRYPDVPAAQWPGLMKKVKKAYHKSQTYIWTGIDPPQDNEKDVVERLKAGQKFPTKAGWVYTYKGRTVVGDLFHYELLLERVKPDGSTEYQTLTMMSPIPPEASALEAQERANSGRPDAYAWSVEDALNGKTLTRRVFQERTEWSIDAQIRDAAGVAHPAESDTTYYGHSQVPPPLAPPGP